MAPEIVRELLKEGEALELGGKQVDIAVLFVDVRGFTTMSEALSQELLERYGRTVSFGVGVHVGPAVVGNIGSPSIGDYAFLNCSSLTAINFTGTQTEWRAVAKGTNTIPSGVIVRCTDAEITL